MNQTLKHYKRKLRTKADNLNYERPLQGYIVEMLNGQNKVRILDAGAGPFSLVGTRGVNRIVALTACDILADEYLILCMENGIVPFIPVEYQNMESLTYPSGAFDLVHCVNALDHTKNAVTALKELCRVCAPSGWVYLRHFLNVGTRHGYKGSHKWNITEDRLFNRKVKFRLPKGHTEKNMVVHKFRCNEI